MKAIMSDAVLDEAGLFQDGDRPGPLSEEKGKSLGDHDDQTDGEGLPHLHYSILTLEQATVVDVDWGYHSVEEAIEVIEGRASKDAPTG